MSPEVVFTVCTYGVLPAWILLVVAPRWPWTQRIVHAVWIPCIIALFYLWAALAGPEVPDEAGFGDLESVMILFSSPYMMLAGWLHFLAFDLFIGAWQVRDAARSGVPHWMVVPCLVLTLLFGPLGLALYFGFRTVRARRLTADESARFTTDET